MDTFVFDVKDFNEGLQQTMAQALEDAELFGASEQEKENIKKHISKTYLYNFLEHIQEFLDKLTNQSIALLLLMLIELGMEFENEEELLYWLNVLERKALDRLQPYTLPGASISVKKTDKSGLLALLFVLQKKNPNQAKIYKQIEKKIVQKQKSTKYSDNSLAILQDKMSAAGVEQGGRYWNQVMGEYTMAIDKNGFVSNWTPNENDVQQINKLRGVDDDIAQKSRQNQFQQQIEQEQKLQKQRDLENDKIKHKEFVRAKNKELIEKEFSNTKNRKTVTKAVEKKDKPLDEKDIKKIKIKIIGGKNR